jgi:hypothetical protein
MVWKNIEHWPSTLEIKKTLNLVTIQLEFSSGMSLCYDQNVKQKPLWPLHLLFCHTWLTDTVSRSCQSIIGACVDGQVCIPPKPPWSLVSLDDICNDDSATQIYFCLCLSFTGDWVTAQQWSLCSTPFGYYTVALQSRDFLKFRNGYWLLINCLHKPVQWMLKTVYMEPVTTVVGNIVPAQLKRGGKLWTHWCCNIESAKSAMLFGVFSGIISTTTGPAAAPVLILLMDILLSIVCWL